MVTFLLTVVLPVAGVAMLIVAGIVVARILWQRADVAQRENALLAGRESFPHRRQELQDRFFAVASESGKPRGLSWATCEFQEQAVFARDRESGDLRALVAVEISFAAIEGGGMEDNPNVGNIRAASAVFQFDGEAWSTQGRAIFNLEPLEAIEHFKNELELIEEPASAGSPAGN